MGPRYLAARQTFRASEAVGIKETKDGHYLVGWNFAGEWLRYTVFVPYDGEHQCKRCFCVTRRYQAVSFVFLIPPDRLHAMLGCYPYIHRS